MHAQAGESPAEKYSPYGEELILDMYGCNISLFNRKDLKRFLIELCEFIDMEREDLHFWDYEGDPEGYEEAPVHLKGTSLVQFIKTSNITIHTLDALGRMYINVFSCKPFDHEAAKEFICNWFKGYSERCSSVVRV